MSFFTVTKNGQHKVIHIEDGQDGQDGQGGLGKTPAELMAQPGAVKAGNAIVKKSKQQVEAKANAEQGIQAGNAIVVKSGALPSAIAGEGADGSVKAGNALVMPLGAKGGGGSWNGHSSTSLIKLAGNYGLNAEQTKQLMGKLGVNPGEGTIKQQLYLAKKGAAGAQLSAEHQAAFESHIKSIKPETQGGHWVMIDGKPVFIGNTSGSAPAAAGKSTNGAAVKTGPSTTAGNGAKSTQPSSLFPKDEEIGNLKTIQSLGGSTGAKLVQDSQGRQFVMKSGGKPGHLQEEHTAEQMYRALGVPVPDSKLYQTPNGPVKLSQYVAGAKELGSLSGGDRVQAEAQARAHFAVDALMANWDAVGMGKDNMLVGPDGKLYRADVGGSLRYRAQGGLKGSAFGQTPNELWTLRDATKNSAAASVFGSLTAPELRNQINSVLAKRDQLLAATPEALKGIMTQRLDAFQKISDQLTSSLEAGASYSTAEQAAQEVINGHPASPPPESLNKATQPVEGTEAAKSNNLKQDWNAAVDHLLSGQPDSAFAGNKTALAHVKNTILAYKNPGGKKTQVMYKGGKELNEKIKALATQGVMDTPSTLDYELAIKHLSKGWAPEKFGNQQAMKTVQEALSGSFLAKSKFIDNLSGPAYYDFSMLKGKMKSASGMAPPTATPAATPSESKQAGNPTHGLGPGQGDAPGNALPDPNFPESPKLKVDGLGKIKGLKKLQSAPLTSQEEKALAAWKDGAYTAIRHADITGETFKNQEEHRQNLYSAFKKLPTYVGDIYRGVKIVPLAEINKLSVGQTYKLEAMSSFSRDPEVAFSFAGSQYKENYPVVMKLKSASSKSMEAYGLSHEKEILSAKGTQYKITKAYWITRYDKPVFVVEGEETKASPAIAKPAKVVYELPMEKASLSKSLRG